MTFSGGTKETPLNIQEHDIQDAVARFIKRDKSAGLGGPGFHRGNTY